MPPSRISALFRQAAGRPAISAQRTYLPTYPGRALASCPALMHPNAGMCFQLTDVGRQGRLSLRREFEQDLKASGVVCNAEVPMRRQCVKPPALYVRGLPAVSSCLFMPPKSSRDRELWVWWCSYRDRSNEVQRAFKVRDNLHRWNPGTIAKSSCLADPPDDGNEGSAYGREMWGSAFREFTDGERWTFTAFGVPGRPTRRSLHVAPVDTQGIPSRQAEEVTKEVRSFQAGIKEGRPFSGGNPKRHPGTHELEVEV
ncbi:hypothetical protein B0H17DRAFT_599927 [Mycena rosella]|uniref:Uncharacterized protein n=1 Tax=Mycena rosella TaxID=1033263 RepID=A0AAD7GDT4_MYCRO|nr:hypothetical protein B0H17DRAFT_599927 [Mycena rosella]